MTFDDDRRAHWERVWTSRRPTEVSWYQRDPCVSLQMIAATGIRPEDPILDVGGGASSLVDRLLERGFEDVTVLDVSSHALSVAADRLGSLATKVHWLCADATSFELPQRFALWHDRAVFHFLVEERERRSYVDRLSRTVRPGGHVIVATFAPDAPPRCSGLLVERYTAATLAAALGPALRLVECVSEEHTTPAGVRQPFVYCRFARLA